VELSEVDNLTRITADQVKAGNFLRVRYHGRETLARVREVRDHMWTHTPTVTIWHECGIIACAATLIVEVSR
jgi:hypothetical protein